MGTYGSIDFDDEEIEAAGHWYGGQGSMLYAITSSGALKRGTIRPRRDDGTPMTDEEWIVDLAERLESEAEDAARDAGRQARTAKGAERKELLADRDGLRSIASKARRYIDDADRARAEHGEKWLTTRHLGPARGGAVRRASGNSGARKTDEPSKRYHLPWGAALLDAEIQATFDYSKAGKPADIERWVDDWLRQNRGKNWAQPRFAREIVEHLRSR